MSDEGLSQQRTKREGTSLQPGQRLGNYRVVRLLGQGGMGAVFEAAHLYIERRAAMKVLHPELSHNPQFRTRFLNEARAVNLIKHPGLVEIYEFGIEEDGTAYIIMEFLEGESLGQRLARSAGGLHVESLHICRQIAVAMAAAHQKEIVHRELFAWFYRRENLQIEDGGNAWGTGACG